MSAYFFVFLIIQVIAAAVVIVLTLLQHGKGADMGAAFGSGSAGSVFGSSGSANFLSRMTSASATVLFVTTLAMAYISSQGNMGPSSSVFDTNEPAVVIPAGENSSTTETTPESSQTPGVGQIPTN